MSLRPFRLLPWFSPRPWGRRNLAPLFGPVSEPIGEVWFHERNQTSCGATLDELVRLHGPALLGTRVQGPAFPILSKFIFTSERLSIQVHPDDGYAWRHENQWGKIEMWYVLDTEPNAELALGFREPLTAERFRRAARSGEIERLVNWMEVHPGEIFVVYPGTVHALGAGVALAEIQQNCDLTYRIYDYGRPRPLHLEKAAEVARLDVYPGCPPPQDLGKGRKLLARTRYFATELMELSGAAEECPQPEHFYIFLFIRGRGLLDGRTFQAGDCWLIPALADPFELRPEGAARLLRVYPPEALSVSAAPRPAIPPA